MKLSTEKITIGHTRRSRRTHKVLVYEVKRRNESVVVVVVFVRIFFFRTLIGVFPVRLLNLFRIFFVVAENSAGVKVASQRHFEKSNIAHSSSSITKKEWEIQTENKPSIYFQTAFYSNTLEW